jgi:hypothetical protein
MTQRTRSAIAAGVLVLVLAGVGAFVLLGRGGSSAGAQTPVAQQGPGGPMNSSAFEQFRQCMAKNGVTGQTGRRPDPSDPTVQKAMQACAQYRPARPSGGAGGFGAPPQSGGSA